MNTINLLPWRESARIQHKKQSYINVFLSIVMALFLIIMIYFFINNKIKKQFFYDQDLILEIKQQDLKRKKLHQLIEEKQSILKTIVSLHELDKARATPILFFNDVIELIPSGVVLNAIERHIDTIMISGVADSSTDIAMLMQKITNAKWIREATLPEIKKQANKTIFREEFKVSFTLNYWRTDKNDSHLEGEGG
jgi:Tfp pilus assembly protein PilN